MLKYFRSTCVLTVLGAVALTAQVSPGLQTVRTTGMVGIADAQTAQLNLLNPGVLPPAVGTICTAAVSFVDASGTVLKSATLSVNPGQSMAFILRSDTDLNLAAGARREIRATISIPAVPATATTATTAATPACKVIPTLEMLDTVSGRTLVVLGHAASVPSVVATPQ
ncbi:MAG TPA: hypothetical protein VK752_21235 [Bryobacteraceae bacterium]|jgi:hypothetical protein|nr:hypothetical protein [Bryobacteraceae bacterium]